MSWIKVGKALWTIIKYAPAVVEAVKQARERHANEHKENLK